MAKTPKGGSKGTPKGGSKGSGGSKGMPMKGC